MLNADYWREGHVILVYLVMSINKKNTGEKKHFCSPKNNNCNQNKMVFSFH